MRGDQPAGRLATRMTYRDADDSFQFLHQFSQLRFDFTGVDQLGIPGFRFLFPDVTLATRFTRNGDLLEQTMDGRLTAQLERRGEQKPIYDTIGEARAKVAGHVENGVFRGRVEIASPIYNVVQDLDAVPVPNGQVLSLLQPVNRIAQVRPGRRWVVHEVNPLGDALAAFLKGQLGKNPLGTGEEERRPLIAEVASSLQLLKWAGQDVPCRVIDYRDGDEVRARTWVRDSDGWVLRQEAFGLGERIALEREE